MFTGLREIYARHRQRPEQSKQSAHGWHLFGGGLILNQINFVGSS